MKNLLNPSEIFNLKEIIHYADEATVSKIIAKTKNANLTLFAFDKGQNLSEHTAPFNALVQVIEGTAKIYIQDKEFQLTEGQIILMPANIPHALEAEEQFKMLLTMLKES